jgi:multisubunit Na+/H+ antiporter MnhG subunit
LTLVDALIYILLILSVGFGGIGVIGLLLFPDIRSRMYTTTRALVISVSAMVLAVIFYALFRFVAGGSDQYVTLIFHILILLCIVTVANVLMQRTIPGRNGPESSCRISGEIRKGGE